MATFAQILYAPYLALAFGLRTSIFALVRNPRQAHGGTYPAYAARVGRFVPGVGRLPAR